MSEFILDDLLTLLFWVLIIIVVALCLFILGIVVGYSLLGGESFFHLFNGQFFGLLRSFLG